MHTTALPRPPVPAVASRLTRWCLPLLVAALATACSRGGDAPAAGGPGDEVQVLRYQGTVGMVIYPELAQDLGYLAPVRLEWVGNTISGPQDIQTVVTGDIEFGTAFNGAVAKLIAAKAPIRAVVGSYGTDENTFGGFYVTQDSPIRTARDLIGKKISVNTLGAHSEFVIREYLARNGLTPAEARQVELTVVPPVNSEQTLRQGQVDVAALTSVLRDKALERGGLRLLFSDAQLYGNFTAGSYVFRQAFIDQNPGTVRRFTEGVAKAIEWARTTPRDEVKARYAEIIRKRARNEDTTLVSYWKSTGIAEPGGVIAEREFQIWIDWLVKAGELKDGQLKLADVYTNQFNPYAVGKAAKARAGDTAAKGPAS